MNRTHGIDIAAAEQFVLANARTLDRHRLAVLLHREPPDPVLHGLGLRVHALVTGAVR